MYSTHTHTHSDRQKAFDTSDIKNILLNVTHSPTEHAAEGIQHNTHIEGGCVSPTWLS